MCTDFYDYWYTTLQMNTNHTGKFITLRAMYILTWWRNVDVTEIMPFTVHVTPCGKERCQILSLRRSGHPIRQIWIRWTTASGVSFKRESTVCKSMMWRSSKNVCWGSGGCWTTPSSRQRLRNAGLSLVLKFLKKNLMSLKTKMCP